MGKKVDGFMLSALSAVVLYFYFRGVFRVRALCAALALTGCIVLSRVMRRVTGRLLESGWLKKRKIRKNSGGTLMRLAVLPPDEAEKKLQTLLKTVYPGDYPIALLQTPPPARLSEEAVFACWKEHPGTQRLVICATSPADVQTRALASSLKSPIVALIDAPQLMELIAEHPEGLLCPEEKAPHRRLRLKKLLHLLLNRRNAPRCLLLSVSLLAIFLLTRRLLYLIFALLLIFTALVSLRRTGRPAKLF